MLIPHPWHWFATLTFRPERCGPKAGMHPEAADKAFRFWVSSLNRELWGPRWAKKEHGGVVWARGQEFHKSGRIHFHAVLSAPGADLNLLARRLDWMDFWYAHFGIARIESPSSQNDVCGYVSKYVCKGGELEFSRNFGRVAVPPLGVAGDRTRELELALAAQPAFQRERRLH
jgi:hypothetical protein